jgi:excisionase family DNA binding protein
MSQLFHIGDLEPSDERDVLTDYGPGATLGQILTKGAMMEPDGIRPDDVLLKLKDVAQRLNIHPESVRKLVYAGRLKGVSVAGRRIRTTERHFAEFLKRQSFRHERGESSESSDDGDRSGLLPRGDRRRALSVH